VETYELWNNEHAAHTIYNNFRSCLAGAARDLWDQINVIKDEEGLPNLKYVSHTVDNQIEEYKLLPPSNVAK
jgi:hypothetical protein